MTHKDILKLLFPIELGGVFDQDIEIEGSHLDTLKTSAEALVTEMFPDTANNTIADWERTYDLIPGADDTLGQRRLRILTAARAQGLLTPASFVSLASALGYTITIEELPANAPTYGPESIYIWRVHVPIGEKDMIYFTAGDSAAGDLLTDWVDEGALEAAINDLKPAHTQVLFVYE